MTGAEAAAARLCINGPGGGIGGASPRRRLSSPRPVPGPCGHRSPVPTALWAACQSSACTLLSALSRSSLPLLSAFLCVWEESSWGSCRAVGCQWLSVQRSVLHSVLHSVGGLCTQLTAGQHKPLRSSESPSHLPTVVQSGSLTGLGAGGVLHDWFGCGRRRRQGGGGRRRLPFLPR